MRNINPHLRSLPLWYLAALSLMFGPSPAAHDSQQLNQLFEDFTASYPALGIPAFSYDYRDNFNRIPGQDNIQRQQIFFRDCRSRLEQINYRQLSPEQRTDYDHFLYELTLQDQRLRLEAAFLKTHEARIPLAGLAEAPGGKEWYRYYVRKFTTCDMTPEEIYSYGAKEVRRVEEEIRTLQKKLGYARDSAGFYRHLRDSAFLMTDRTAIIRRYQDLEATVRKQLPKFFPRSDADPLAIMTWPNAGPFTPPGYYSRPEDNAFDKGIFYFNFHDERHNRRAMDWLFIHEAIPGHHFQNWAWRQLPEPAGYRRHFNLYPGNFEGWGAYVEYLGRELGLYSDDYSFLGKWEWDLVRSVRILLDVGIHDQGWTREQALAVWRAHIPNQEEIAEREVQRVTNWPGQALSYKVGAFRIEQLRDTLRQKQGRQFDIRKFHQDFLSYGRRPLAVIEKRMIKR